jgi:hypothetical protein
MAISCAAAWERMCCQPKHTCCDRRINARLVPPGYFVTTAVDLAMMTPAQRHGELIAYLPPERTVLSEAQMVRIAWRAATDETRLLGDEADMLPVPNTSRLWECKHSFVDRGSGLGATPTS